MTQEDKQQIDTLVKAVNEALDSKDIQRLKSANAVAGETAKGRAGVCGFAG